MMKAVGGLRATYGIALLNGKRCFRSRILLVGLALASIPLLSLLFGENDPASPQVRWDRFVDLVTVFQLLVTAIFTAQIIAEEIENKTYTYLWSRPIPRWSILIGKLSTGILMAAMVIAGSVAVGSELTKVADPAQLLRVGIGLLLGIITAGSIASCIGTLLPKYALAVSIAYFLVFDVTIGALPFASARLSVRHNVTSIIDENQDPVVSILWLAGLAVVWSSISLHRLARKEFSTGS